MTNEQPDHPNEHNLPSGKGIFGNRWVRILEIAVVFSPGLLVLIAYRFFKVENPMLLIAAVWMANAVMLILIWTGIKYRGETLRSIGLAIERPQLSAAGWTVLKSIPILVFAVAAFILGSIIMANIVGIPEPADMTKYNYLKGNLPMLVLSLAGVYIVSSFAEEVIYRGFLITRLEELFGGRTRMATVAAITLSAVIFGFAHFEWGAMGIGQTTLMGAALGISFLFTGRSLWPLILAHCYMDTLLLVQLFLAR